METAAPQEKSTSKLSEAKRQAMNVGKREDAFPPNVQVVEEILEIVEEEDDTVETAPPAEPISAAGVRPQTKISDPLAASTESRRSTRTFEGQSEPRKEAPKRRAPGRFLPGLLSGMLGAAVSFAAVGYVFADTLVAVGEALGATDELVALGKALGANVGPGVMGWMFFCGMVVGAVFLCGLVAAFQDRSPARCFQLGVAWFAVVVLGVVFYQPLLPAQPMDKSSRRGQDVRALMHVIEEQKHVIKEAEKELEALVEDAPQESNQPDGDGGE